MKICIIGGGPAGLADIKKVKSVPSFEGIVFEQSTDIGGVWIDPKKLAKDVNSPMYDNLRTNLPKETMQYLDLEFRPNEQSFVTREQVEEYLQDYAHHHNLRPFIQFEKQVISVKPKFSEPQKPCRFHPDGNRIEEPIWEVTVRDLKSGSHQVLHFDSVIVCSGHYCKTVMPPLSHVENFQGQVLHSRDYRHAESFRNLKVVIVGAGPSAADIALDIAAVAAQVIRSYRSVPEGVSPVTKNTILVGPIKHAHGYEIEFENEAKSFHVDAVMFATGYQYDFPFLDPKCGVEILDNGKHVSPLYKHMIHTKFPSLCFLGIPLRVIPFPMLDVQASFYTAFLQGKLTLPSQEEMNQELESDLQMRRESGLGPQQPHQLGQLLWDYLTDLAEQVGIKDTLRMPVIKNITEHVDRRRKETIRTYKKDQFTVIDNNTYNFNKPK